MSNIPNASESNRPRVPPRTRLPALPRLAITTAAALALLAVGGGVGAGVMKREQGWRMAAYAPVPTTTISAMSEGSPVEIKGQVAEIFGNKFILQDGSGRALVETGRQGEDATLVKKDEAVSVQGRFEHGFLHAAFIVHPDGKIVALDVPPGPPRHGPGDWFHGPRADADSARIPTGTAG